MKPTSLARWSCTAAVAAALGLASLPAAAVGPSYSALYVFGDSLSDPGNLAAFVPPNPAQLISGNTYIPSQPYASGQFTNGNVWAIDFAGMLGMPGAGNPFSLGGGNYAYGGARTSTGALPPSLLSQVNDIYLPTTGHTASPTALYVLAGGGNDGRDAVVSAYAAGSAAAAGIADPTAAAAAFAAGAAPVVGAAAAQYAASTLSMVNTLHAAGADNIIVWNIPNLGLAPAITAYGTQFADLGTMVSGSMNAVMEGQLALVSALVPGVKLFNDFGLLTSAAMNPGAFGLTNVTDACGNPSAACNATLSTSLFWDGIHPTVAGHTMLAQQMYALAAVPEPQTVLMMAVGVLGLLGWSRRRAASA